MTYGVGLFHEEVRVDSLFVSLTSTATATCPPPSTATGHTPTAEHRPLLPPVPTAATFAAPFLSSLFGQHRQERALLSCRCQPLCSPNRRILRPHEPASVSSTLATFHFHPLPHIFSFKVNPRGPLFQFSINSGHYNWVLCLNWEAII